MPTLDLGHALDPATLARTGRSAELPVDALTRHAVCVGATGSGKTGLCVTLLERLAGAGVPMLVLDPKGDLANLALVFDRLDADAFRPWVDPAEAARARIAPDELAARTAARWREGLAAEGVTEEHLRAWRQRVAVTVHTPGSEAGVPVDVLTAVTRAPEGLRDDPEGLRDYVVGAASALLGLVGREADPLTDPCAILLARLLGDAFAAGRDLPLDVLVSQVVAPPFARLGFFPVDEAIPPAVRRALALDLNAVLASPAFAAWRRGVPLDVGAWLAPAADGRTPVRVLSLAHLDDRQRMFFVSLLLHAVVAWTRRLPGTGGLRALLYFDEVTGFVPPHPKDPPSKAPALTLLKQARSVGLGVVLCTQNPVDVDYKALSNASTWIVGRLPTRQDRARVLDGLVGAGDRDGLDALVANLPARTFVWRTAGTARPGVLASRHAMSFLRGPLTRREIAALGQGWSGGTVVDDGTFGAPPPAPPGVEVRWLHPDGLHALGLTAPEGEVLWRPAVVIRADVTFEAAGWSERRSVFHAAFPADGVPRPVGLRPTHLLPEPPSGGRYAPWPPRMDEHGEVRRLTEDVVEAVWLGEVAEGPAGPVSARRDGVRLGGVAMVWVPTGR